MLPICCRNHHPIQQQRRQRRQRKQQRKRKRQHKGREESDHDIMNSEFVPRLQTVSGGLSILNSLLLLAVGGSFLVFPRWVLSVLLDYNGNAGPNSMYRYDYNEGKLWDRQLFDQRLLHHEDPIDSVASMIGGVLVAQGLACFLLIYPMMVEGFSSTSPLVATDRTDYSQLAIWNVRTSLAIQLITGLLWIVIALHDDKGNEAFVKAAKNEFWTYNEVHNEALFGGVHRRTTFGLLLIGFALLILGFASMMMTFWPATNLDNNSSRSAITRDIEQDSVHGNHNLTEPLLMRGRDIQNNNENSPSQGEREDDDELEASPQHDPASTTTDESNVTGDAASQGPEIQPNNDLEHNRGDVNGNEEESQTDEPTSRIRGTQRLLAVAAPQVVYLYIGCITLLIRLPFSLSIPHFVSTTLGALADGEYDRARREIIWLFMFGTIDAFLDFWCIFCKSGS